MNAIAPMTHAAPLSACNGALHMVQLGFKVFPLRPNTKEPFEAQNCGPELKAMIGGIYRATTDAQKVKSWFDTVPDANYGVYTGDHLCLDVDVKNGKLGIEDLISLGPLPATLTVTTPTGGMHLYFQAEPGLSQRKIRDGIDIKTGCGYVVGPGSKIDGTSYDVTAAVPVARLPEHVLAEIKSAPERHADASVPIGDLDTPIAEAIARSFLEQTAGAKLGSRNSTAFWIAAQIKDFGLSVETIAELLDDIWSPKCEEPLSQGEIEAIAASAYSSGKYPPGCRNPSVDFEGVFEALGEIMPKPANDTAPRRLLEFPGDITPEGMAERDASALIRKLIYPRDQGMIYGESGTGKSFLALDLCWHVAAGIDWHGRKVNRAPVLYAAMEGSDGFRKRMIAYKDRYGDTDGMFARLAIPVSLDSSKAGAEGVRMIVEAAKQLKKQHGQSVGLIVVDTLARAINGEGENDADAIMNYLQKRVGIITQATEAAVITVHHENKQGGVRGSTALFAGLDFVLHATGRQLDIKKAKDDDLGALFGYTLQPVEICKASDGEPITSCIVRAQPTSFSRPKPRPAKPPTKTEQTLAEAWREIEQTGRAEPGINPSTRQTGKCCDIGAIRDAFCKKYGTGDADTDKAEETRQRTWRRLANNLPPGYSIEVDDAGNNVFWAEDDVFPELE